MEKNYTNLDVKLKVGGKNMMCPFTMARGDEYEQCKKGVCAIWDETIGECSLNYKSLKKSLSG